MAKLKANKPTADVLMNSMRAMGYSFEAAIADIVDNSVSAQARNICVGFFKKTFARFYVSGIRFIA